MITTILFDLWETLATKKLLIFDVLKQEYSLPDKAFDYFVSQLLELENAKINEDEFWQNLRLEFGVDSLGKETRLIDIYRRITIINNELVDLALDFKSRGGRIAIFSNTDPAAKDYLDEIGLLSKFDESFFSFDFKMLKPDKAFIECVLATMDVQAQNTAYFDDNLDCIETATNVGVHGFVYKELTNAKAQIQQFTYAIVEKA